MGRLNYILIVDIICFTTTPFETKVSWEDTEFTLGTKEEAEIS